MPILRKAGEKWVKRKKLINLNVVAVLVGSAVHTRLAVAYISIAVMKAIVHINCLNKGRQKDATNASIIKCSCGKVCSLTS